ncbi:hypothetical protein ABZ307_44285, partial [Streptomyces griseorubiginosus]
MNLVKFPGAACSPQGDVIEFSLAREAANAVLDELRGLGLKDSGAITVEQIDLSISTAAEVAEQVAPGDPEDAVVWDELAARVTADTRLSWSFLAFLA